MQTQTNQGPQINAIQPTLPKGGGAIQGIGETFSANEFTGTAALSVPIALTPCRDLSPQLSVDYSSGGGNGIFGLGFGLSLPEITRQTSKGIPKYDGSDTFLFSGADYLVPDDTYLSVTMGPYQVTRYLSRTEGSFDRIEQWVAAEGSSFWKVTTPDNLTYIFGKSDSARIVDPQNEARIFKWLLEETFDAKGNHILYQWESDDPAHLPQNLSEQNRTQTANKYIGQLRYGNVAPIAESILLAETPSEVQWHFEVVFDYGQYDFKGLKPDQPYQLPPDAQPRYRLDPFSTYHAGFEIRTARLCYNVLLFHHFPAEFQTDEPVLTRRWQFVYQPSPVVTLLEQVQESGYSYQDGQYTQKRLPSLSLAYSAFQPEQQQFGHLQDDQGQHLVGVDTPPFQLVDLYGEGLPGILYSDGYIVWYREPQGSQPESADAHYAAFQNVPAFPLARQTETATHTLTDVTGNGHLDLLVSSPAQAGYYAQENDRRWLPFQPFVDFPTDYHNPLVRQVDVSGEGLVDLLVIEENQVRVYPNQRRNGFGQAWLRPRRGDLPTSKPTFPQQDLRFADMAGAGTPQFVRLTNGRVDYWPSLGYGAFGARVTMENAPHFGDDFDTARLFLVDADGSGTADLVYVYPDKVHLFLNESGNRFAEAVEIRLPGIWDNLDQIQFADVYGNGTTCLVFTQPHPTPQHWCYDFSGQQKPYLLTQISNNIGGVYRDHLCQFDPILFGGQTKGPNMGHSFALSRASDGKNHPC